MPKQNAKSLVVDKIASISLRHRVKLVDSDCIPVSVCWVNGFRDIR